MTWSLSSWRRAREIAFLAEGRLRVRSLMLPVCGAGNVCMLIRGGTVEYARRVWGRRRRNEVHMIDVVVVVRRRMKLMMSWVVMPSVSAA